MWKLDPFSVNLQLKRQNLDVSINCLAPVLSKHSHCDFDRGHKWAFRDRSCWWAWFLYCYLPSLSPSVKSARLALQFQSWSFPFLLIFLSCPPNLGIVVRPCAWPPLSHHPLQELSQHSSPTIQGINSVSATCFSRSWAGLFWEFFLSFRKSSTCREDPSGSPHSSAAFWVVAHRIC